MHPRGRYANTEMVFLRVPNTVGVLITSLLKMKTGFDAVILENSDAYYTFVVIQEAYSLATQDTQAENEWFEDRATGKIGDPVLDFTESNPFGDPTESI